MGYYVDWDYYLELKEGVTIGEIEKAFKKDKCCEYWEDNLTFNGAIEFEECNAKYHEEDYGDLFVFLAKYVVDGSSLDFNGEDGAKWRVLFDGKGNWDEQPATILYDYHPFKTFMKKFEDEMPEELKKKLEKWHKGIEVLKKI